MKNKILQFLFAISIAIFLNVTGAMAQTLDSIPSPAGYDGYYLSQAPGGTQSSPAGLKQPIITVGDLTYLYYKSNAANDMLFIYDGTNLDSVIIPANIQLSSYSSLNYYTIFNSKLYTRGRNTSTNNKVLIEIDGTTVKEVSSPAGYTGAYHGILGDLFVVDSVMFMKYGHDDGYNDLMKFNGTTLTPISFNANYQNYGKGYFGIPIIMGADLYLSYLANDNIYSLVKYDGSTLTKIASPSGYDAAYNGYTEQPFVNEGTLYMKYYKSDKTYNLVKYDGSTITEIPTPSAYTSGSTRKGYIDMPIMLGSDLLLRYIGGDGNYDLFKYDGSTLTEISSPAEYSSSSGGYFAQPIVIGSDLYMKYRDTDNNFDLMKYDGANLIPIPCPEGYAASYKGYNSDPIEFGGNLYMKYVADNGNFVLFKYDGVNLTEVPTPDGFDHYYAFPIILGEELFLKYKGGDNNYVLFKYNGDSLIEIPSPTGYTGDDKGYRGSSIVAGDNLLLTYLGDDDNYDLFKYSVATYGDLFGSISYANNSSDLMKNDTLFLIEDGSIMDTAVTNASGEYLFEEIAAGEYQLECKTEKVWAGGNATDALWAQRHFVHFDTLDVVPEMAADVNASGGVNSSDALLIKKRFTGSISEFPVGSWYFDVPDTLVLEGVDDTLDIQALCFGDLNGSNSIVAKKGASTVQLSTQGFLVVNKGDIVEIPVYLNHNMEVGAVSLVLEVPSGLEVQAIESNLAEATTYFDQNNVALAWSNIEGTDLYAGEKVMVIKVKVSGSMTDADQLVLNSKSEFANAYGDVIEDVELSSASLQTVTGIAGVSSNTLSIFPNPVLDQAFIQFNEEFNGTILVTDLTGKQIVSESLTNAMSHSVDMTTLESGIYMLQLKSENSIQTIKLIKQ